MTMPDMTPFPTPAHDHARCVAEALDAAEAVCRACNARLTRLRRRVLEIVLAGHAPVGAYDILDRLQAEDGRRAAPVTVYRALDFLIAQRLVHRLASLNAFIGCVRPAGRHGAQFLICGECRTVAELSDPAIERAIARGAGGAGFAVDAPLVEVEGTCPNCLEKRTGDGV